MMEKNKIDFLKKLGAGITALRKKQGLTMQALANKLGKERQSINRIEKGKTNLSIFGLNQLSEALEIPLADLVKLDHTETDKSA
jgi:putative transcriptional regulator